MLRKFLTVILPLAAPFLVYWVYLWFARFQARKRGAGEDLPSWAKAPWTAITLTGVVLMAGTLLVVYSMSGSDIEGTYVAPRYENGRIVPGRVEPPD